MGYPTLVVHPPQDGGRLMTVLGEPVGVAKSPGDVEELLRRAGINPDDVALDDPDLIEWRGGGPEVWG
ncbi:hypothetical protein [Streptantibioticus ferralitis]|uniref:Uncharacterized protein n=1 Tax=Streptantibioticus ferralitis TaxID=236510 RepID=A0ABT5YTI2_9ACTN|nr:hypothetical protein [Streptantibioticus ferralitis]MDF2254825.1 hypothetical protein [Streptantibioticus ferralitis]